MRWLAGVVGVAALAASGASAEHLGPDQPPLPVEAQAHKEAEQAKTEPRPRPEAIRLSRVYEPHCDKPADKDEAELCEQRRANGIAVLNVLIGGFGLAALVWTLWLTRLTAKAALRGNQEAARAAKAAEDSVKVSQDTALAQLRPYLFLSTPDAIGKVDRDKSLFLCLKNYGQTPALAAALYRGASIVPRPVGDFEVPLQPVSDVVDLAPGEDLRLEIPLSDISLLNFDHIARGFAVYLVRAHIAYAYGEGVSDSHEITAVLGVEGVERGEFSLLGTLERNRPPKQEG